VRPAGFQPAGGHRLVGAGKSAGWEARRTHRLEAGVTNATCNSRFAANIPLIRRNLCPLSFVDVPARDYIDGILGVYELNRIDLLRDVFMWAYERSCARYAAVRRSLGEPDPFRLRYREQIAQIVGTVIRQRMDRELAIAFIRRESAATPAEDRARLIEVAETEIMSLHEGNFARYRVRPSEYEAWHASWR
jgi:hypothetical protein